MDEDIIAAFQKQSMRIFVCVRSRVVVQGQKFKGRMEITKLGENQAEVGMPNAEVALMPSPA
jgi:hypothetical protein